MDTRQQQEVDMILYLMLEDRATAQQIERLNVLLQQDPEIVDYAMHYYLISAALRKSNIILSASFESPQEADEQVNLLKIFAEEERNAPTIVLPVEKDAEENPVRSLPVRKADNQKTTLFVLAASLAAILLFFASVRLIPNREPVAFLAEAVSPRWHNGSEAINLGDSFYNTDDPKVLKSGTIEIEFNYGARVVIEGPAEFSCKSDNMIHLHYGRIYSRVPKEATGFTVHTDDARIVDLGTEFGVQVNIDGTIELHVTNGKTSLIAGDGREKEIYEVLGGQARQISQQGSTIKAIELKNTSFAQRIDTETGLVWKGRKTVNLADIVGGGNGFDTGVPEQGIDPGTGRYVTLGSHFFNDHPRASNTYKTFEAHPFIDGVFVPNSVDGVQIISGTGLTFPDCPKTNGNYFARIINGTVQTFGGGGPGLVLNGIPYGTPNNPSIFMHTNQGITFDIAAIRKALHGTRIVRFESLCGISQTAATNYGLADMYVLVDGQVRFRQQAIQKGQSCMITIELREEDRFLTLVTATSEGKQVPESYNAEHGDWCLFAEPVLILE